MLRVARACDTPPCRYFYTNQYVAAAASVASTLELTAVHFGADVRGLYAGTMAGGEGGVLVFSGAGFNPDRKYYCLVNVAVLQGASRDTTAPLLLHDHRHFLILTALAQAASPSASPPRSSPTTPSAAPFPPGKPPPSVPPPLALPVTHHPPSCPDPPSSSLCCPSSCPPPPPSSSPSPSPPPPPSGPLPCTAAAHR